MLQSLNHSASNEQQFWTWFEKHEDELFHLKVDREEVREEVFDRLHEQLSRVHPSLAFEFGPEQSGRREFVISAGGDEEGFPSVIALAEANPGLPRWQVTAFRPRRSPLSPIELRGTLVDPNEVEVSLLHNGKIAGLYVYIPGYEESEIVWKEIGYLLLDEALGEFDVHAKVGLLRWFSPDASTEYQRFPISELAHQFDFVNANAKKQVPNS